MSDLRLYLTLHEVFDSAQELVKLNKIGQIEIAADAQPVAEPKTNMMLISLAFSAKRRWSSL